MRGVDKDAGFGDRGGNGILAVYFDGVALTVAIWVVPCSRPQKMDMLELYDFLSMMF